ncbi:MAG TPA: S26 family signal peptidase [Mycobacteriales bacterium]|nr:S26 family signal peptidase [Mycobacteriales bacterium]
MRWPLAAVLVAGTSMVPTLLPGDAVLVWRGLSGGGPRVRAGDLVVARFRARPDRLVVKRAVRACPGEGGGWWLLGDNPAASDDSRGYGPADVVARVVCRYWPPVRRARPGST